MVPSQQFTIEPPDAGNRLDKFLTTQLTDTTRSQVQKLIKAAHVTVNGEPASVHQFLKVGDVIKIDDHQSREYKAATANGGVPLSLKNRGFGGGRSPGSSRPPSPTPYSLLLTPKIIYEDDDVLVIDKPAGLLVHPTPHQSDNTLTDWLVTHCPTIRNVGPDPRRPGIVHRLDRDVSGLMVMAKTQQMYGHLVQQFTEQKVQKTYAAVVYGVPTQHAGTIRLPIGRSASGTHVAHPASAAKPADRAAETNYRVVETYGPYAQLEVSIATGRPHQIRAHLAAIGHPIVGDREYGPTKPFHHDGKRKIKTIALDRLLLHVTGLQFTGPDGTPHAFTSPTPKIFTEFIQSP